MTIYAPIPQTALRGLCTALLLLFSAQLAFARTIVITDEDCERMAAIASEAPRLSWAAYESGPGTWTTQFWLDLRTSRSLLIAFPLDKIPKGQRITNAELVFIVAHVENDQRLTFRRILGDWGIGVCHDYRMVRPKKLTWGMAGARALSTDCAAKASAVARISSKGEKSVNVTEDVELWYTGAAKNQGWIVRVEDQSSSLQLYSPLSWYPSGRGKWQLRITYEPEE
jgi:hypothetical protein